MTELKRLADLTPDPHNPRRHTARNLGMITESLQKFGANRGIVVDETGTVLAGNGVLEAAMEAGFDQIKVIPVTGEELVVIQVSHLTPEQKDEYKVADNRSGETATWDMDELRALMAKGIPLDHYWFQDEFDRMAKMNHADFAPNLAPIAGSEIVTEKDLGKAKDEIDEKFTMKRDLMEVICPHCGTEFYLDRK